MKRFITVAAKHAEEVLIIIRNAAAAAAGADAYAWVKQKMQEKQISHNDQHAHNEKALPHQGGYTSFYLENNGQWMKVNH